MKKGGSNVRMGEERSSFSGEFWDRKQGEGKRKNLRISKGIRD